MREENLTTLITEYGKDIFSFCLRLCNTRYEAEELYQETFLKLIEKRKEIDRSKNPKSLLISIAIGIYRNQKKKYAIRQRIAPMTELDEHMSDTLEENRYGLPEQAYLKLELTRQLREEISHLPDKYRVPLLMYYTGGMSYSEIGAVLKLPKGTIKSRLFKARQVLKERLEGFDYENGYE